MANSAGDKPIYEELAIPDEAIANGGVEIIRAGLVDDELYVTARHAFKDPAQWGEVLADITRRLALLYSMETDLTEAEAMIEIEEAYAAEMGAKVVEDQPAAATRPRAPRAPRRKTAAGEKPPAKPPRKKAAPPPDDQH
ncbi:MAG: DUF5076 domain-containing protein [Xanthobacteraceae bacterium]